MSLGVLCFIWQLYPGGLSLVLHTSREASVSRAKGLVFLPFLFLTGPTAVYVIYGQLAPLQCNLEPACSWSIEELNQYFSVAFSSPASDPINKVLF